VSGHANALLQLFLAFAGARLLGHVFQRLKLPVVVGELAAGAILGPQLLDLGPTCSTSVAKEGKSPE
jgi:Kef-type K+ transport system membrane component KefB